MCWSLRPTPPGLLGRYQVLRDGVREDLDAEGVEAVSPGDGEGAVVRHQLDAHHRVVPVVVVPDARLGREVVDVPVLDADDLPADEAGSIELELTLVGLIAHVLILSAPVRRGT